MCKYAALNDAIPKTSSESLSREDHFRLMLEGIQDSAIFLLNDAGMVQTLE